MLADFYRRWLDLCFQWLPKAKDGRESGATTDRPRSSAESSSSNDETIEGRNDGSLQDSAADDLTVIKGVGPATMIKLRGAGITSFADLAASDPDDLARRLGASQPISATRVKSWIEAAQERAA